MDYVKSRISRIRNEITLAQASANENNKSSMGDKYETGRAMAQLEVERNSEQLLQAEQLLSVMHNIPHTSGSKAVTPGALVTTTNGTFYIAISLGQVTIRDTTYLILSSDSPMGKLLIGRKVKDTIHWNSKAYTLLKIE